MTGAVTRPRLVMGPAQLRNDRATAICGRHVKYRQIGQAMTEFLVVALAMMPLFLLIPMIAKYQDVSHTTQMAARYVAFDGTIRNDAVEYGWKSEATLADEVRRRFFGNSDAPIKTGDIAGEFDAHRNLFWRGPDNQPLLQQFSDVTVSFGSGYGGTHADGFEPTGDMTPFVGTASQLKLVSHGIYTANVHIKLANLPADLHFYRPFDSIDLSMTRSSSLLLNPWTAKDTNEVSDRIKDAPGLFPAGQLASVAGTVSGLVSAGEWGRVSGPKLGELDFWNDVVPEDRFESQN